MSRFVPTPPPDAEQTQALDNEHDGIVVFAGPEAAPFVYVIRRPTPHELSAYSAECKRGRTLDANRALLRNITVYPDRAQTEQQLTRWPASAGAVLTSDRFTEFSGGVVADHQK